MLHIMSQEIVTDRVPDIGNCLFQLIQMMLKQAAGEIQSCAMVMPHRCKCENLRILGIHLKIYRDAFGQEVWVPSFHSKVQSINCFE